MSETSYKAAKYIRLSYTDDKENESDSVVNQRKLIDSFIENHPDIEAVSEQVDDGVSGIIFDRKAFKDMMADIRAGEINCVIVKDLSRLGREYIETGRYLRQIFPVYGVRFIAINDNIDTLHDNGDNLAVSVKSLMNDAYCRDISVKTRSALNVKRDNGDFIGACPVYGYRKSDENKNQLVIDEYASRIVKDIFTMKLGGYSAVRIADSLNALGILSPYMYKKENGLPHPKKGYADKPDAKWSATTIIRVLSDETYTGTLIQGRQGTFNYKIKNLIDKPETEWKRTENAHEPIISKGDFNLAQRIMRLDTRTTPHSEKVHIFSGVLICGCCGERMTRKTVPGGNGKKYHYYYCPTTKKRGCHNGPSIKEDNLAECVLESIKSHISNIASLETILESSDGQRVTDALIKQYTEQITDNERQLTQVVGFKTPLYENMINGTISKDDYKILKAKYTADEERLRGAIDSLKTQLNDVMSGKSERIKWIENFKQFEGLTELDRRTVTNLIHSIRIITKTKLEITFNYQSEYETALALAAKGVA